MFLNPVLPHPSLREFIHLYRIMHFTFEQAEDIPFKAYRPRIEHCLQFFPKDSERVRYDNTSAEISEKQVSLVGQHTQANYRFVGKNFFNFQVSFKPGALYRLTGIPVDEFTNQYLDAVTVFGSEVLLINEELASLATHAEAITLIEFFLHRLINRAKHAQHRHAIDTIASMMSEPELHTIDWYVKKSGYSHRQFDREFNKRTGINPQEYLNIQRFDRAFLMKNRVPETDWLSIALACGFHDYQHLAKTYKRFTGVSPNEFFLLETKAPERHFGNIEV